MRSHVTVLPRNVCSVGIKPASTCMPCFRRWPPIWDTHITPIPPTIGCGSANSVVFCPGIKAFEKILGALRRTYSAERISRRLKADPLRADIWPPLYSLISMQGIRALQIHPVDRISSRPNLGILGRMNALSGSRNRASEMARLAINSISEGLL
jgi:hypothetical protein